MKFSLGRYFWVVTTLLLSIMAGLGISSGVQENATADEAVNLSAGFSHLTLRDYRMDQEHPALGKMLNAIPLLFLKPYLPTDDASWASSDEYPFGNKFLYENRVPADALLLPARAMTMLITLLLGIQIAVLTRSYFGVNAALFAVLLFCFEPTIIAHSRYVTNDVLISLCILSASSCWATFVEKRSGRSLIFTGLTVGAALSSKFSGVLILPALGAVYWFRWWQERSDGEPQRLPRLSFLNFGKAMSIVVLIAWVMIWAVYAFETKRPASDDQVAKFVNDPGRLARVPGVLGKLFSSSARAGAFFIRASRLPIPMYSFWKGLYKQSILRRESYLLGKTYGTGSLFYFPVALAVKMPVAVLFLLGIVLAAGLRLLFVRGIGASWRVIASMPFPLAALIIPVLIFLAGSSLSRINIGVRHILPIYSFLIVLVAAALFHYELFGDATARIRQLSLALAALLVLESVSIYPHYLAFFNFASGGPSNGPRYVIDSNIDWGQDLRHLQQYVTDQHVGNLCLSYFGWAPPAYYGIQYRPLPSFDAANPVEGCVYAVSVNALYSPRFLALRRFEPDARIGYSIYVYKDHGNRGPQVH